MTATAAIQKDEFVNEAGHQVGVVIIDGRGDAGGSAVKPGDSIFLSEDEQIATANAPKHDHDNPLRPGGPLKLVRRGADVRNRRPYGGNQTPIAGGVPVDEPAEGESEDEQETGAAPTPEGEPVTGVRQPGEEVATPEAAAKARPSRRRGRVTTG